MMVDRGNGRGDWIRTNGTLLPKQVLYQAELRPECVHYSKASKKMQVFFHKKESAAQKFVDKHG